MCLIVGFPKKAKVIPMSFEELKKGIIRVDAKTKKNMMDILELKTRVNKNCMYPNDSCINCPNMAECDEDGNDN